MKQKTNFLRNLESESIYIIREVFACFERPVMLYSIGKDSSVLLHLARKAFAPAPIPFPLLHIDTTYKFKEMISFRDKMVKDHNLNLIVYTNEKALKEGITPFGQGSKKYTDIMKTQALLEALKKGKFDSAFGGARRDEEKSRAKERIFSFRDKNFLWDPKNQRPELWQNYNTHINPGESMRVFPLSNWTELDVWMYIKHESIPVVPLYFARPRPYVIRDNSIIMVDDHRIPHHKDEVKIDNIRFRTLGCYPLTAAIKSDASTIDAIINELIESKYSERQGRLIDKDVKGSMELKKKEGYF